MRAVDVLETLELIGSTQWNLVTAYQAQEAGVSKMSLSRLADRGTLRRVRHGVYALPSAGPGPLQELRAAWLATSAAQADDRPAAVVSGESAAAVHGLGDLVPSKHEFSVPSRRQTTQRDVRYRKRELSSREITRVDGLPVTTVARTVADLAPATDFDHLAVVVRDAFTTSAATSARLAEALEPAAGRFGYPDGESLLTALLKAGGYRPDVAALDLATPEQQVRLLRLLAPRLPDLVERLTPDVDLSFLTGRDGPVRVRAELPQREDDADAATTSEPAGSREVDQVARGETRQRGEPKRSRRRSGA